MRDKKIHAFAKTRVARFKNEQGQQITWALHQIIDICPALEDDIGDIAEIYSRHFNNIDAYKAFEVLS